MKTQIVNSSVIDYCYKRIIAGKIVFYCIVSFVRQFISLKIKIIDTIRICVHRIRYM